MRSSAAWAGRARCSPGSLMAYKPDIMAMAKAIGSGVPVGAFAMTEEVAKYSLEPGDHGTTYGGNPLVCAAVAKTIEIFRREKITDHVQEVGAYLTLRLKELVETCDGALEQRGKGLIQGLRLRRSAGEICAAALKEGLLVITRQKRCDPSGAASDR